MAGLRQLPTTLGIAAGLGVGATIAALTACSHAHGQGSAPAATRYWTDDAGPQWISLTWSGDPSTTLAVTWRTDTPWDAPVAQIAPAEAAPGFFRQAMDVAAESVAVEIEDGRIAHFHSVEFAELQPDTLYAFRAGDGGERWSAWSHHRTASAEVAPFSFLYFGDIQNDISSHWPRLARAAGRSAPDARFAVYAGDIVANADHDGEWAAWHAGAGWLHADVPMVPVVGNHEYTKANGGPRYRLSRRWRPQFALPTYPELPADLAETSYYLDYQGVRLVVLNLSTGLEPQARWLEKVLEDNPHPWSILAVHQPIFSGAADRDEVDARRLFKPICDRFDVDLVLQGHDHTYVRGHIAADAPRALATGRGAAEEEQRQPVRSVYVVSMSGGKMYPLKPDGWQGYEAEGARLMRSAENTQLFQVIRVDGPRLSFTSRTVTGEIYDAFFLFKAPDGSKQLVETGAAEEPERRFDNTPEYSRP